MGTPDPSTDMKAETMRIASKVGIVLATVAMTIGLLGEPCRRSQGQRLAHQARQSPSTSPDTTHRFETGA